MSQNELPNQHITMISEESGDTQDWSMVAENSAFFNHNMLL